MMNETTEARGDGRRQRQRQQHIAPSIVALGLFSLASLLRTGSIVAAIPAHASAIHVARFCLLHHTSPPLSRRGVVADILAAKGKPFLSG